MDELEINKIINLDTKFYKDVAEEFSKTRKTSWDGWDRVLNELKIQFTDYESINVLDLGCGNGRFYAYLSENLHKKINFLGLDNNDYLLIEALLRFKKAQFKNLDVISKIDLVTGEYDMITIFGLAHHIPGNEFRKNWFLQVAKLLKKNGLLIVSFWDLESDDRFNKAHIAEDLEDNDYYYGWGDTEFIRYVHLYSQEEIHSIEILLKKNGLDLISIFSADGKNKQMNKYLIFKRVNSV